MSDDSEQWGFDTRAVRVGHRRTAEGEHSEPIFPTSSYVFESAAQAAARFGGSEPGNIYSRFTNPTVQRLRQGVGCVLHTIHGQSVRRAHPAESAQGRNIR